MKTSIGVKFVAFNNYYRMSLDGVRYTYCDSNGAGSNPELDGFQLANTGTATVN